MIYFHFNKEFWIYYYYFAQKKKLNMSREKKKIKTQIPQSVISFYKKYSNTSSHIKTQIIMGTRYDIDDRYEIIDISYYLQNY